MAMRKLRHHEQRLLKKVDFLWQREENLREIAILRRYNINNREDYVKYNKLCGFITKISDRLQKLSPRDPVRISITELLLKKLHHMGLISTTKSLSVCSKLPASAFCRRRLPVVMVRMKFCGTLTAAVSFIEQEV